MRLNVSSLASPQFATSYSLGTIGLLDGTISYLYTSLPMRIPSQTLTIPLRTLVPGYRQLQLPLPPSTYPRWQSPSEQKDTLLNATLHLPSPSRMTGLYLRRVSPQTLVSLSVNSTRVSSIKPPPAALLAHVSHDTGKYSVEGLASTDNALVGVRGLWNFGSDLSAKRVKAAATAEASEALTEGLTDLPSSAAKPLSSRPSLLSAGGEFYYSPLSSAIGLSTGLRFATLSLPATLHSSSRPSKPLAGSASALSSQIPSQITGSSFPYTLTLTLTPLTGSLSSTYSVRASPNLSLSSRFGFNVYSWESEYVLGAEIWRKHQRAPAIPETQEQELDGLAWARAKMADWYEEGKRRISDTLEGSDDEPPEPSTNRLLDANSPPSSSTRTLPKLSSSTLNTAADSSKLEESVIKLRLDDGWNIRALWTGRIKELLVSAGFTVGPAAPATARWDFNSGGGNVSGSFGSGSTSGNPFRGTFGVEIFYSS